MISELGGYANDASSAVIGKIWTISHPEMVNMIAYHIAITALE